MEEEQNSEVKDVASEEKSTTETKVSDDGNKTTIIAVLIVAVLIFGALEMTGTTNFFSVNKTIATVNDEKITQKEFDVRLNQILSSTQAQAFNLDDPEFRAQVEEQVLGEIINTKLLLQAAVSAGYTTTDEAVQGEYDLIVESLGGVETLATELANGGLTDKKFRENIGDQLVIQQYIDANLNLESIVITSEEINAFYEGISHQEGIPPLSEIESQIEGQILSEKEQAAIEALITSLRSEGSVEIIE